MRVGLIAEGPADLEVLANILKGWLGLDRADLTFLVPDLSFDETDLRGRPRPASFSNWEIVKRTCQQREIIDDFLSTSLDEERLVILQIDTAECELSNYGVARPPPGAADAALLLARSVLLMMLDWLGPPRPAELRAAVCVEEMDAWVLAHYVQSDTDKVRDPKKKLGAELHRSNRMSDKERKALLRLTEPRKYAELSKPLRKRKVLEEAAGRNVSLALFLALLPEPPA